MLFNVKVFERHGVSEKEVTGNVGKYELYKHYCGPSTAVRTVEVPDVFAGMGVIYLIMRIWFAHVNIAAVQQ